MAGEGCFVLGTAAPAGQQQRRAVLSDAKRAQLANARISKSQKAIARRAARAAAKETGHTEGPFEITITVRRKWDALESDKTTPSHIKRLLVVSGAQAITAS